MFDVCGGYCMQKTTKIFYGYVIWACVLDHFTTFNFEKIFTRPPYYTLISIIYYILSHVSPK